MKIWSKHSFGFINIDDDHVYFTKTGNWSEVVALEEKSEATFRQQDRSSKLKVIAYFSIMAILFLFGLIKGGVTFTIVVIMTVVAIAAYRYMLPEFGASFKIPKSKIEEVKLENNDLRIFFLDADEISSQKTIKKINDECREALLSLNNGKD